MARPSLSIFRRLSRDQKGATAIEYGLIVAMIALALVVSLSLISGRIDDVFARLVAALG